MHKCIIQICLCAYYLLKAVVYWPQSSRQYSPRVQHKSPSVQCDQRALCEYITYFSHASSNHTPFPCKYFTNKIKHPINHNILRMQLAAVTLHLDRHIHSSKCYFLSPLSLSASASKRPAEVSLTRPLSIFSEILRNTLSVRYIRPTPIANHPKNQNKKKTRASLAEVPYSRFQAHLPNFEIQPTPQHKSR